MPYKDPKKKKQWERNNRGKGSTHAIWWGYLYEDSSSDDWESRIRESGYECVWAIHDKDVRPTGEIKEKHAHVAVRWSHAVDAATAKEVLASFGVKEASVQWRDNWRGVCRYRAIAQKRKTPASERVKRRQGRWERSSPSPSRG